MKTTNQSREKSGNLYKITNSELFQSFKLWKRLGMIARECVKKEMNNEQ